MQHKLLGWRCGMVGGDRLRLGAIEAHVDDLREAYETGLPRALEGVTANI
jgi:hypothetical protein